MNHLSDEELIDIARSFIEKEQIRSQTASLKAKDLVLKKNGSVSRFFCSNS